MNNISRAIKVCREVKWLQRERFSEGLTTIFSECKNEDHFWILENLLHRFKVVGSGEVDDICQKLGYQIERVWALMPADSVIVSIAEGPKTCGSHAVTKGVENHLGRDWDGSVFNSIRPAFQLKKKNIVIVDDFIGTGAKVLKRILGLKRQSRNKCIDINIFVVSIASMEVGFQRVSHEIGDNLFSGIVMRKAISEGFSSTLDLSRAINAMIELEGEVVPPAIFPKQDGQESYQFGYGLSEAIFWVEGANIPNNVFPVFWWENYCEKENYEPKIGERKIKAAKPRVTIFHRR